MKRFIFFILILFYTFSGLRAQSIYIHLKDGSIISLNLANIDRITFDLPTPGEMPDTLLAYIPLMGMPWMPVAMVITERWQMRFPIQTDLATPTAAFILLATATMI